MHAPTNFFFLNFQRGNSQLMVSYYGYYIHRIQGGIRGARPLLSVQNLSLLMISYYIYIYILVDPRGRHGCTPPFKFFFIIFGSATDV